MEAELTLVSKMVVPFLPYLKKELSLKVALGYTFEDFDEVLNLLANGE